MKKDILSKSLFLIATIATTFLFAINIVGYYDYDYDYDSYGEEVRYEKVRLNDRVVKETVTVIRSDSDGDGILDDEDKFPNVNDYLIVRDDNRNGIVDEYEK